MTRRTLIGAVAALGLMVAPAEASGGGGGSGSSWELLSLNFREAGTPEQPLGDGAAGPVATKNKLSAGKRYLVVVAGTVSAFQPTLWDAPPGFHLCGTPASRPLFTTPGVTNGQVGTDAEYNFARPFPNGTSCPAGFPRHQSLFEMDAGDGFRHYEPVAGRPTGWLAHVYAYVLAGQGKKLQIRELDSNLTDNYGVYKILVFAKGQCGDDGWKSMQPMGYRSQSDCTKSLDDRARTSAATVAALPFDDGMGADGAPFE